MRRRFISTSLNSPSLAPAAYWSLPVDELLKTLHSNRDGLDAATVADRSGRQDHHPLSVENGLRRTMKLLFAQLSSPLMLILIIAAVLALIMREWIDASIVLGIVLISAVLSSVQEYRASNAVAKLRQRVSVKATVLRGGQIITIPADGVLAGDVVLLSAGSLIPADGVVLEAIDLFVSEALLTGETFPVEKRPGTVAVDAALPERSNSLFMGTSVRSGSGSLLVVETGAATRYGQIADRLLLRPPETEFERGLRQFGGLLIRVMVIVVIVVLAANIALQRPTMDTVLFALALAVGLSPELLPAVLTITLARGAQVMARQGVIVKHLASIENLGSMDVLCTDKTGTLTKGVVQLDDALNVDGGKSAAVLQLALLNSAMQSGLANALDEAVVAKGASLGISMDGYAKHGEIPYDFVRKRLGVVTEKLSSGQRQLVTKGALDNVLEVCDRIEHDGAIGVLDAPLRAAIEQRYAAWSAQGFRVLGIARKDIESGALLTRGTEANMIFCGFLLFFDPPEPTVAGTLDRLRALGVQVKIITGDNALVARHVAQAVGIAVERVITGAELASMKDEALWHLAPEVSLFAAVDPNQKERIITALQKRGHVVGYLGDGINDAPALHAADVGISVDSAVDVAKEAADFVLLEHNLEVLRAGIEQGRHTFANTLKYIFVTTSANFGNMISMALASIFLPFLPLLAKQILLNNFLSDVPAMGIASDNVDREWEATPHRWDIKLIRNFMVTFGLVSTLFDLLTFATLLYLAGETPDIFRTGWFVESLLTELLILFIIRTHRPFHRSRPGRLLIVTTIAVFAIALLLPYLAIGAVFSFVPLPLPVLFAMVIITALYVVVSEITKRWFFRRIETPVIAVRA